MPEVKIIIKDKSDPTLALPDLDPSKLVNADLESFVIIERGMKSGKTSVTFHVKTETGEDVIIHTSAAIFDAMHGALKGAEQRFKEKASINPNQMNIGDIIGNA